MQQTISSDIGFQSSSKTLSIMNNPIQSMTILIPAICSVIVLTVIILVACFVIHIKRQQYFNPTLRDGTPDDPDHCCTNNNVQIQPSTTTISNHQGKEFNYPIGSKNFDHCGLCNLNTNESLLKTDYLKENIEMLDNNKNNIQDSNYATLKIRPKRTQRTADIKSSNLRSSNHHHRFSGKNPNPNNQNTAKTKPNISPMIWLLVSCWKLNLVIN